MKPVSFCLLLFSLLLCACTPSVQPYLSGKPLPNGKYPLILDQTGLKIIGQKDVGKRYTCFVPAKSGKLIVKNGLPKKIKLQLDPNQLRVRTQESTYSEKVKKQLKSSAFLDVDQFSTITILMENPVVASQKPLGSFPTEYFMDSEIQLKNRKHEVRVACIDRMKGQELVFSSQQTEFNRKTWNLWYADESEQPLAKYRIIGDTATFLLEVRANLPK